VREIITSMKRKPINPVLIGIVLCLYFLNNKFIKAHTDGLLQYFMICHFNDFICPLFFMAYSNLLLISVNREIKHFKWLMLFGFCSGLIWEFFAPVIKPSTTTDIIDVIFYCLGTALYWCIIKVFPGRRITDDKT
jgi:hypothetical protein